MSKKQIISQEISRNSLKTKLISQEITRKCSRKCKKFQEKHRNFADKSIFSNETRLGRADGREVIILLSIKNILRFTKERMVEGKKGIKFIPTSKIVRLVRFSNDSGNVTNKFLLRRNSVKAVKKGTVLRF